jgi:hypothetical protein
LEGEGGVVGGGERSGSPPIVTRGTQV